jgi:hydrogenase-4 component E
MSMLHVSAIASAVAPVSGLIDLLVLLMLAAALLLVAVQRFAPAVYVLAAQSIALAGIAALVALATGELHIWLVAGLTLAVKGGVTPRILFYIIDRIKVRRELVPVLPVRLALVLAVGLTLLAYTVTGPLALPSAVATRHALPAAVAAILLGGLLMVTRRKALMQIVGLMVMENGLYLAAIAVTAGMPLLVELGISFDLLLGALVMGVIVFRINQTFDTINTDRLRRLRH